MSNQQKFILVVLAILGLLFFLGLGAGFVLHGSSKGEPGSSTDTRPPDFVKLLDEWLAPFGPKLKLSGVQCNHQPVTRTFQLTQAAPECVLTFPPAPDGEKTRKASLRIVAGGGIPVQFAYKKPEQKPGTSPDPCFAAQPNGLKLIFTEVGQTPSTECWSSKPPGKPIRIIALQKAATLRLLCEACQAGFVQLSLVLE